MMNETLMNKIMSHFGYSLKKWEDKKNGRGAFRPKVLRNGKESQNLEIFINSGAKNIFVKDYACNIHSEAVFNYDGKTQDNALNMSKDYLDNLNDECQGLIQAAWSVIREYPDAEGHPLFKKKKLLPLSGIQKLVNKKNNIYIKFEDIKTGILRGIQIRDEEGGKMSVRGSSFFESIHKVQIGRVNKTLSKTIVFLSESFTTALEIAELRPSDSVYCTAGNYGLLHTREVLLEHNKNIEIILVLDKNKHEKENNQVRKILDFARKKKMNYIIPDLTDPRLHDSTDFNDMSLVFGKYAAGNWLNECINSCLPLPPRVVGKSDTSFSIVSSRTNTCMTLPFGFCGTNRALLAPQAYWDVVTKQVGRPKKNKDGGSSQLTLENKKVLRHLELKHALEGNAPLFGIGFFMEEGRTILNAEGIRVYLEDGKVRACPEPVPFNNHYANIPVSGFKFLKPTEIVHDPKTVQNFIDFLCKVYGTDEAKILFMLGFFVQAAYSSFTERRAHMWVNGPTGSGKSTLIKAITEQTLAYMSMSGEDVSAASITQSLSEIGTTQTSPIVFVDEFFSGKPKNIFRSREIMDMVRNACTNSEGVSKRGTAELRPNKYVKRFAMVACSPEPVFEDSQDAGRWISVTLDKSKIKKNKSGLRKLSQVAYSAKGPFCHLLLSQASKFSDMQYEYLDFFDGNKFPEVDFGHIDVGASSIIAGAHLIMEYLNPELSKQEIIEKLCVYKSLVEKNVTLFKDQFHKEVNVFMSMLQSPLSTLGNAPFFTKLIGANSNTFWNALGITIRHEGEKVFLLVQKSKLDSLEEYFKNDRNVLVPVRDIRIRISNSQMKETRLRVDSKRVKVIKKEIDLNLALDIQRYLSDNNISHITL